MFLYFLDFSQILHATIATYILTPKIRYSSYSCCSVTEKTDVMVLAYVMVGEEADVVVNQEADIVVDDVADMEVDKVANMVTDKMANEVAAIEVDKMADMVADMDVPN